MRAQVLADACEITLDHASRMIDGLNQALILADCNTPARVAMFVAMCCEESAHFSTTEEFADGSEYEGRTDLGNVRPGDGKRFKGRTYIQITGRNNYGAISKYAFKHKLVPDPAYFVNHPRALALQRFAWLGPVQYWAGDHNHGYGSLNAAADAHDIKAATLMVNGGLNGFDTRKHYWNRLLPYGAKLLADEGSISMLETLKLFRAVMRGGRYATPALKRKYPMFVKDEGVLDRLNRLEAENAQLKRQIAGGKK